MLPSQKVLNEIRTLLELVADERTNGPTANWELIDRWLLEAHRLAVSTDAA